jgi:iron(III) transport system ATP-binding protein
MSFLQVSSVVRKETDIIPVSNVSFSQEVGERLAVVGETGSGKSTLLRMIAGLLQPDEGRIDFEGKRVKGPLEQLIPGHTRIAYLSQHFELRNHYRVEEVLDMVREVPPEEAEHIYNVCRIDHLLNRRTNQISGGERQRIAIARLLTTAPSLMILDEPFSNLDLAHKVSLKEVLEDAGKRLGITFLLAAHDPQDVMAWAERILVLKGGELVASGIPASLYRKPASKYVAGLFGKYNLVMYGTQPVMLRPEDVVLNPKPHIPGSVKGIVRTVRFQGFYQEVEVDIEGQRLTAFAIQGSTFRKGQEVVAAIRNKLAVDHSWMSE